MATTNPADAPTPDARVERYAALFWETHRTAPAGEGLSCTHAAIRAVLQAYERDRAASGSPEVPNV